MRKWLLFFLVLIAPFSYSQVPQVAGPFSPFPPPYNPYLPSPLGGSASVAGTASGASVTVSGSVNVATKAAGTIPVPTSVAAQIPRARVLAGALSCTTPLGAIACAATAAAVAKAVKDAGVGYGPCPAGSETPYAFICKPGPGSAGTVVPAGWGRSIPGCGLSPTSRLTTAVDACDVIAATCYGTSDPGQIHWVEYGTQCRGRSDYGDNTPVNMTFYPESCSGGGVPVNGVCGTAGPMVEASESDIQQTLQQRLDADYNENRRLVEAMRQDQESANNSGKKLPPAFNPVDASTPVQVTAPPVTTPKKTESITQAPKSDGSTDTIKKESQTTITPTTSGSTAGDSKTIYNTSTVITTTVTNNVTNVSNVTTETVDEKVDPPKSQCEQFPDSVACQKLGDPPKAEDIPRQDVPVTYTPIQFASNASCPSPVTYQLYGARAISWQPFCDQMAILRPIFLACAAAACAWIFMKGMSSL